MKWTLSRLAAASCLPLCLAAVLLLREYGLERLPGLKGAETIYAKAQDIQTKMQADTEVARINGEMVTAAELHYAMGRSRTKVIEYFRNTYNLAYEENFWKLEIDGENPLERLKREALAEWTQSRILLEMAQEAGLTDRTDFSWLLSEMEQENKRRSQAAAAGNPAFGPAEMDEGIFIPYYLSNLELALQEKLTGNSGAGQNEASAPGEPAIGALEEQELGFTRISIDYRSEEGSYAESKAEAERQLSKVRQLLLTGRSPEEAVQELKNDSASHPEISLSSERLDSVNARVYFREQGSLYDWLTGERETGEVSPVLDAGLKGEYVVAVLDAAGPQNVRADGKVRQEPAQEETSFGQELEQRVLAARVEQVEPGYSGLQMQ